MWCKKKNWKINVIKVGKLLTVYVYVCMHMNKNDN